MSVHWITFISGIAVGVAVREAWIRLAALWSDYASRTADEVMSELDYLRGYIAFLKQQDVPDGREIDRIQQKVDKVILDLAWRVSRTGLRKTGGGNISL